MKLLKYLFALAFLLLFASCDQVIFPEPQPRKVKPLLEIPESLQGTYVDENGDSLFVHINQFSYYTGIADLKEISILDSSVLKSYKGYFYYSIPVWLHGEQYWQSYILFPGKDGFDLYTMNPDDIVKLAKL